MGFKGDCLIFHSCSGKTPVYLKIARSAVIFPLTSLGKRNSFQMPVGIRGTPGAFRLECLMAPAMCSIILFLKNPHIDAVLIEIIQFVLHNALRFEWNLFCSLLC